MSTTESVPTVQDVFVQAIERQPAMPENVVRYLSEFRLPDAQQMRVKELSQANRNGTLSSDEDAELKAYRTVIGVFQLLKAKAIRSRGSLPDE